MAKTVEGRKVRYAVVGGGWIAQAAFMPGVAQTGNSELAAIVTGDPMKAKALADRYGIAAYGYDDYPRLLERDDVDAIYLALPNQMHTRYAVPALRAGLHLLLEKPMATSSADCNDIIQAARSSGAKLMVAYRLHFEPATLDALRRVRSGEIGELSLFSAVFTQFVDPRNHRAKSGFWAGPVPDMGPYPINAARSFFGAEPREVQALGTRRHGFPFDDTVAVTLRFPEERVAQFTVAYGPSNVDEYRLVGTRGEIAFSPAFLFGPGLSLGYRLSSGKRREEKTFPSTDQFGGETKYFSQCILEGRDPEPDGSEGLADVRICEAIERALRTGNPQKLPPMVRPRRIDPAQAITLRPITPPPLVNAAEPGQG